MKIQPPNNRDKEIMDNIRTTHRKAQESFVEECGVGGQLTGAQVLRERAAKFLLDRIISNPSSPGFWTDFHEEVTSLLADFACTLAEYAHESNRDGEGKP